MIDNTEAIVVSGTDTFEKRKHSRHKPRLFTSSIIQKDWGQIAQIGLDKKNILIAEIKDVSLGGLACDVAYQFDVIDPIAVSVTMFILNDHSGIYSYVPITLDASIIRATQLKNDLCQIGLRFDTINKETIMEIDRFIQSIS